MLKTVAETADLINRQKLLHISGSRSLLRKLPCGNWIGGSTEYFMGKTGGQVNDQRLDVRELNFDTYKFALYDVGHLTDITKDAYSNGFSIAIMPFDSDVHIEFAKNASNYEDIFLKNIVGWISGCTVKGIDPMVIDGRTGDVFDDKAVVLHVSLPEEKTVSIGIVNIFTPEENSPVIEFTEDSFHITTCLIDGKEDVLADYLLKNKINTKLPLIGDYSGTGINIGIKSVGNGVVEAFAPVFKGIEYRTAKNIGNYAEAFREHINSIGNLESEFACICFLNFLHGELEGEDLGGFYGPITLGEIAYQFVNQSLVYMQIV